MKTENHITEGGESIEEEKMILFQFVGLAAWYDWRSRKIPNEIIIAALFFGFIAKILLYSDALQELFFYSGRFILCLFLLLPVFYSFKAGAGDLKLFALVLAYLGIPAGIQFLFPGLLLALCWDRMGMEQIPLAAAWFLGALPVLLL